MGSCVEYKSTRGSNSTVSLSRRHKLSFLRKIPCLAESNKKGSVVSINAAIYGFLVARYHENVASNVARRAIVLIA